jgi:hypothetical protein
LADVFSSFCKFENQLKDAFGRAPSKTKTRADRKAAREASSIRYRVKGVHF